MSGRAGGLTTRSGHSLQPPTRQDQARKARQAATTVAQAASKYGIGRPCVDPPTHPPTSKGSSGLGTCFLMYSVICLGLMPSNGSSSSTMKLLPGGGGGGAGGGSGGGGGGGGT